jgi:hypothetical protein
MLNKELHCHLVEYDYSCLPCIQIYLILVVKDWFEKLSDNNLYQFYNHYNKISIIFPEIYLMKVNIKKLMNTLALTCV